MAAVRASMSEEEIAKKLREEREKEREKGEEKK